MTPDPATGLPLHGDEAVHLVGIGGAGMSPLAVLLLQRGHRVSGSDLRGGREAAALEAMGAVVHTGHDAGHVAGADLVAVSAAVPHDNPELVRARELGLPVLRRPDLLERVMAGSRRVLVTGTHGKTTTTAMVTVALQAAGLDPSFAIGGTLHEHGTAASAGTGDVFVAEADEAYRSFLSLTADCAVVTNVEMDHHDEYADEAAVHDAFAAFLQRSTGRGPTLLCADDPGAVRLAPHARGDVVTYGEADGARLRVTERAAAPDGTAFRLALDGEDLGPFRLPLLGRHNVANAAAAVGAARWAGTGADDARAALAAFAGTRRRFQRLGSAGGVTVVDDYAHHPTEVAATVAAARQREPEGRVVAAFQPHRYSRTAALGAALGQALAHADVVVVADVYAAGEQPVPGVTGDVVADAARAAGAALVHRVGAAGALAEFLADVTAPGDLVLTMGAGDITEVGPAVLRLLQGSSGD